MHVVAKPCESFCAIPKSGTAAMGEIKTMPKKTTSHNPSTRLSFGASLFGSVIVEKSGI
jgi:hypothetical protein